MEPTIRLRLATRIHFALLRRYGEDVEVSTLLRGLPEAREAMWVCEASGNAELISLARQFAGATAAAVAASVKRPQPSAKAAPQDAAWARDTSGFGLTLPPSLIEAPLEAPAPLHWLRPTGWLRRGAARDQR